MVTNKTIQIFAALGLIIFILAGCTQQPISTPDSEGNQTPSSTTMPAETQMPEPVGLENTHWNLISFGPQGSEESVVEGSSITLSFENGQAVGSGGCNSYGGPYEIEGDSLRFGEMVSTLRACADEDLNQQEVAYLQALRSAGEFEWTGEQLQITYGDGQGVLTFEKVDASAPTPTTGE